KLKNAQEYMQTTEMMENLGAKREELSSWYDREKHVSDSLYADLFQIEDMRPQTVMPEVSEYLPNGFELEFYYPEQIGGNDELIKILKQKNGWQKIYTSNKDASVYHEEGSAGVIMPDESLVSHNGLLPAEYASRIMRNKAEEGECLKILETFEHGYVNKHCSFHQHVSAEHLDIPAYKRLLKRMMQHEKEIVSAFAAEERQDSRLLYATYLSNNLGQEREKDYPLLCLLVEACDNKDQLRNMAGYGYKYKTLNLMPEHTVEFRYMNGHFNRRFAEGFLQFNRELVAGAIHNSRRHINRVLLHKYSWLNNQASDKRTVMKPIHYMYAFAFDRFDPSVKISDQVKDGDITQARLIAHALNKTGKIIVKSPQLFGRL
ncbi:MAG: amidoligase family protein, partial [Lachnospiraceae bacterium]|nr:amidoligase family protein [Lachnospiraceae bacterium]